MKIEKSDSKREIARMDYEAKIQVAHDRRRFQQEIGLAAIKLIVLVNGGAIIALLTFIGDRPGALVQEGLRDAFTCFALGIAAPILSLTLAWFAQEHLGDAETDIAWDAQREIAGLERQITDSPMAGRIGALVMAFSVLLILGGTGMFIEGAFRALDAIAL